jgi:hypothetical protein
MPETEVLYSPGKKWYMRDLDEARLKYHLGQEKQCQFVLIAAGKQGKEVFSALIAEKK